MQRKTENSMRDLSFFGPWLKPIVDRTNAKVHQFLTYVLNSNLEGARAMLLSDISLLWSVQSIGEHMHVTGLQLARNLGDVGMCEMMLACAAACAEEKKVYITLPEKTNQKKPFDTKHFDDIAGVIGFAARFDMRFIYAEINRHRNPNHQMTPLSYAMDDFRRICDAHGEMTPQDVVNAFLALATHREKFETDDELKLFFLQVIGYVERLSPVWFGQALVSDINNLLGSNRVFRRVEAYRVDDVDYPMVALIPSSGFGFNFACDGAGLLGIQWWRRPFYEEMGVGVLTNFIELQNQKFQNLANAASQPRVNI